MAEQDKTPHYHVGWRVDTDRTGNSVFHGKAQAEGAWEEMRGKDPGAGVEPWDCVEDAGDRQFGTAH